MGYQETKAFINANIKPNGKNEITGSILNTALNDVLDSGHEEVNQVDQKLVKIAAFVTGQGDLDIGTIYYNTNAKEIRQKTGSSNFVVIPFYDGAIYTYNNTLYVYDGTELIPFVETYTNALKIAGQTTFIRQQIVNVNNLNSKSDAYVDLTTARQAVPATLRRDGLIITYKLPFGWFTEQFLGFNESNFANNSNWSVQNEPQKVTAYASSGRFWSLGYPVFDGRKYKVMLEGGDVGNLIYGSTTVGAMEKGKWVEFEAASNSFLSVLIPQGETATDAPTMTIVEVNSGSNILIEQDKVIKDSIVPSVLFDTESSLLKGGDNALQLESAISSVHCWGLTNGRTIGLSGILVMSNPARRQFYFVIYESDGTTKHGIYKNINETDINANGLTYLVFYADEFNFYPSHTDRTIIPSEIRIAIDFSKIGSSTIGGYDSTALFVPFSARVCDTFENPYTLLQNSKQDIYVTCKRNGTSGVDADFCGLNAIGDAVTSITDASENKQYYIMVDGHFMFTNPKMVDDGGDFKYEHYGEPTPVFSKKNVHIYGVDKSKAVVEVDLDENLQPSDFPTDKSFMSYQPVYVTTDADIRNITFIGKNVRYTSHIEQMDANGMGAKVIYKNCSFISKLSSKGSKSSMTIGEIRYFDLMMIDCDFYNENKQALFGGHTPLSKILNGRQNCNIEFNGCNFASGGYIGLNTYAYNRQDVAVFKNCKFSPEVTFFSGANADSKRGLGDLLKFKIAGLPLPYSTDPASACALRIKTTTGSSSSVRVDPTCTAFGIFGNSVEDTIIPLPNGAIKTYGYEYKDDANGANAYACGWVNIDATTGNSLGSLLEDCSSTSKTLRLIINGTDYSVVFNTDLTNETNENIIALINAVISSVAVCDTYNPERSYYPEFDGEEYGLTNSDSATIEKGMAIVKSSIDGIRRAKQTDGYIDGIAIDTIYVGQKGRIITKGKMFNSNSVSISIYPILTLSYGDKISVDADNDGMFIKSNTSPVLKALGSGIVEII